MAACFWDQVFPAGYELKRAHQITSSEEMNVQDAGEEGVF